MGRTHGRSRLPEGWHTVTPRLIVHDAEQLVDFLRDVFGATGEYRQAAPSVVTIGDSVIMISDAGERQPMPAFLYVYVDDADATHRPAVPAAPAPRARARWRTRPICPTATAGAW